MPYLFESENFDVKSKKSTKNGRRCPNILTEQLVYKGLREVIKETLALERYIKMIAYKIDKVGNNKNSLEAIYLWVEESCHPEGVWSTIK